MIYIKTTDVAAGAALPFKSSILDWIKASDIAVAETLVNTLLNTSSAFSTPLVLFGCEKTGSITFAISGGYIVSHTGGYTGLLYSNPATGLTPSVGQTIVGTITESNAIGTLLGYDPVTFSDGTTHNVHTISVVTWSVGTSGSGDFDYDDLEFLNNPSRLTATISTAQWDNGSGSTDFNYYKIPFNKLVIDTNLEKQSAGSATIVTLPSGYRPAYDRYFTTFGGTVNPDTILTFKIATTGAVTLHNVNGTLTLGGGDVYTIYAEIPLF